MMKIDRIKTWIRKNCVKVAPYTHLLPKWVRQKLRSHIIGFVRSSISPPLAYERGADPEGINLFGFFKAENGLAQGVKLYGMALEASNIPHTFINTDFLEWLPQNDTTFDAMLKKQPEYSINVVHVNPDQWESACRLFSADCFDKHYTIGVWLWEFEEIPAAWQPIFPYVNELWAPSEFVASALRKAVNVPVTVIPYGISVPVDQTLKRSDFQLSEDAFLVLVMYDSNSYVSRKNPKGAVEAFLKAFGNASTNARLVVKINNPKPEDIAYFEEKLGEHDNYDLITETMPKQRLNALIGLCDVYLSLHRSEGFGLIMAEAMALGKPVVATNWSANVEFMPEEAACMVDYSLVPVRDAYQFNQEMQRWADADTDQAADYLRRLFEDRAYYETKAKAGKTYISKNYSVACTADKMMKRYQEIIEQME